MKNSTRVKILGITGGIGSGKTVATLALLGAGFTVLDADSISRDMFAKHTDGESKLMEMFPKAAADGALDRRKLREIISADPQARERLNAYTHPLICAEIKKLAKMLAKPLIIVAPLLFESGLNELCDRVVTLSCPRDVRAARIAARDNVTLDTAYAMIDAQMTDDERSARADISLCSDIDEAMLKTKTVALCKRILLGI